LFGGQASPGPVGGTYKLLQSPIRSGFGHFATKEEKIVTSDCFPLLVSSTNLTLKTKCQNAGWHTLYNCTIACDCTVGCGASVENGGEVGGGGEFGGVAGVGVPYGVEVGVMVLEVGVGVWAWLELLASIE